MKAVTTTIRISSRASVKVRDNYYTVEYEEERSVPADLTPEELADERAELWDVCNNETDNQIREIVTTFAK